MDKLIKTFVGMLAIAVVTGCATQPTSVPPYLAKAFPHHDLHAVASISYLDEHGRPISEPDFAAQYEKTRSVEMMTKPRGDGLQDVTVRLRSKSMDVHSSLANGVARLPVTEAVIDFRSCVAPHYPVEELQARHTGTVRLNFLVGVDGYVKEAKVAASSGFPGLDRAAILALARCRFRPAMSAGVPIEQWSPVQYDWTMN